MACHDALKSIQHRDRVASRVGPHDLIVEETQIGAGTVIEQELTRRLFKLRVAALEIECGATPRDLSRFCIDLVESDDPQTGDIPFAEKLAEHGVGGIIAGNGASPGRHGRGRATGPTPRADHSRAASTSRATTRAARCAGQLSLSARPRLGEDRSGAGTVVRFRCSTSSYSSTIRPISRRCSLRLTDDDVSGPDAKQTALERKYSDVTRLFSALDPRLAGVMFGKLARAVLNLDTDRRNNLLQRTILPGLLDGDANGKVLRDFPDMDLAESICLLLDLETAAPEVLSAALNRLDVSTERRAALVPLIEARMRCQRRCANDLSLGSSGVERHARELIRIDTARETDFSEFAAFDLSMDAQAELAVIEVRAGIAATDVPMTQLLCAAQLVRIERNPGLVEAFLRRALELLGKLERAGRWNDLIEAVEGYSRLGEELRTRRPDVTDVIAKSMGDYCTPTRLLALATLHERDEEGRALAPADAHGARTVARARPR